MDPVRNPFAPGAGQRPPELAGRDREVDAFEIVLERVARGRPERSLVLTGLRGVGKTVLLGELRSMAIRAGWGAGKIEARPDAELRRPLSAALHRAIRDLAVRHENPERVDEVLGILKAFAQRSAPDSAKLRERWQPGIDVAARSGRADSGDIEIDLVELFTEVAGLAADVGTGVAILIDEMQDLRPDDVSALCAACHELSQSRAPLVVVGAGLPHLPAVLSASKSYSERLFRYARIGQLDREDADFALLAPAEREDATFDADALDALFDASGGYPYFVQAYGKAAWDAAVRSPITAADVKMAAPEAEAELAVGFFGSRYERATPAEREYLRGMAELTEGRDEPVNTSSVADHLHRRASSLSPARDSLLKKGLVFSAQRGQIAFTVPHFGRYLLANGT
ncbi:MAG: ATP-binding protein [Pseudonocardia sp.]|nr:ATP-binding protein [Pseudonocardia sp.]